MRSPTPHLLNGAPYAPEVQEVSGGRTGRLMHKIVGRGALRRVGRSVLLACILTLLLGEGAFAASPATSGASTVAVADLQTAPASGAAPTTGRMLAYAGARSTAAAGASTPPPVICRTPICNLPTWTTPILAPIGRVTWPI